MRLFNKVAIIGVGLIGGSIGLSVKKRKLARQVIGISRHKTTIDSALARGAVDLGFFDVSAVREADLIILATPVQSIIHIGVKIAPLIRPDALVTDVGSTKKLTVKKLENILPNFVGAHPLAGSEKQGVINADADLFQSSLCLLTPTRRTLKTALRRIRKFWIELGSRVVYISPAKHDKFIAYISHLPHIVSFSLVKSLPRNTLFLASRGLKDTTRIAMSSPGLWRDILLTNSENILEVLEKFSNSLASIKSAIVKKDAKALGRILKQATLKRQGLNHK